MTLHIETALLSFYVVSGQRIDQLSTLCWPTTCLAFYLSRMQVIACPEGDSNRLSSSCVHDDFLSRKWIGPLHSAKYPTENGGLSIFTGGILFHEGLAGYSTLHLQLFIISCALRELMAALPLTKQRQGYLFHPTDSLGLLEIGFSYLKSIFSPRGRANWPSANIQLLIIWTRSPW